MGIYDRDYSQAERGFFLGGDRMMVTNLLLITVGVYLVQLLVDGTDPRAPAPLTHALELNTLLFSSEFFTHPWWIFKLVTYGFAHARNDLLHVAVNMFIFWFFGRELEHHYGRREFLAIYLTAIIAAGLVWLCAAKLTDPAVLPRVIGASGGIAGVVILFAIHWPRRIILIWGIIPAPVWLLAALWLVSDALGVLGRSPDNNVAYVAHLAGAAYGAFYYRTGWSLGRLAPEGGGSFPSLKSLKMPRFRKPQLKVHDPEEYEDQLSEEVDRILAKIQAQGQDSLTAKERRALERASRRYQQKHR